MYHVNYRIEGLVQGVGFRPFIYQLATKYGFKGYVLNDSLGVEISLEGHAYEDFEKSLHSELPPLARIDLITKKELPLVHFKKFSIRSSEEKERKTSLVSPDFAMCENCLREMRDRDNRRFNYFFINCTDCGPRYSIIKTVPYDRPNTSMKPFIMCQECQDEYDNPLNRRYHAQPISCSKCGPTLSLKDISGKIISTNKEALKDLAQLIKDGFIVAAKGLGGFHLMCDASNEKCIEILRKKKNRPSKPFAVMMKSIGDVQMYCEMSESEKYKVTSKERPIVILKSKKILSSLIAPFIDRIGVFLPYTPLHVILLDLLDNPIIATSANKSGEPIITNACDLQGKLSHVIDYYLDYNRDILNASDDSVLQVIGKRDLVMRASRGIAPMSLRVVSKETKKILAVGAHQKNSIAIYLNNQIILSPFIGDLDTVESFNFFEKTLATFKEFYNFEPDVIIGDLHPNYASTAWAKSQNLPFIQVQHHYAHILACMCEHNIDKKVLGVAWDGTGYGDDGTIWGGEFFVCDRYGYERVAYFEPFLLLGGDASIKDIKRVALSLILDCPKDEIYDDFLSKFTSSELHLLKQVHAKTLNSPKCSSVGRLFDGVAALCGVCNDVSYDGESGLILESFYDETITDTYNIYIDNDIIKYKHTIKEMIKDKNPSLIASKFINSLVYIILSVSEKYKMETIVSGGVFQNKTLLKKLIENKEDIIFQNRSPINDSSIALGQLTYYLSKIKDY